MCWWCGSFAPGANFMSIVAIPVSRSTTRVLPSTPAKEVFSQGSAATSTKRDAMGGNCAWARAFGVCPLMFAPFEASLPVLPDLDDLHGIGSAALADRLADGEDDQVALLHHAALDQHLLRLVQQLLAVVPDILHHERIDVA